MRKKELHSIQGKQKTKGKKLKKTFPKKISKLKELKRSLKVEKALDSVRASALSMKKPADMLDVCRNISRQLTVLKVKQIRNAQTAIIDTTRNVYVNYEYFA